MGFGIVLSSGFLRDAKNLLRLPSYFCVGPYGPCLSKRVLSTCFDIMFLDFQINARNE